MVSTCGGGASSKLGELGGKFEVMSAISFSTKVEKETDDKGDWAKITLRGKWYVVLCALYFSSCADNIAGCHTRDFKHISRNVNAYIFCRNLSP